MNNKYICIHGHFYQPPRENPWLNDVEVQDSAYPFHDWNHRITTQCYARNAASRILDGEQRIVDIINNYARISFNFGPTLLEWMEKHQPDAYRVILDADKESQERFSGHGSALAQAYNHMIMPLANDRDKETQIIWGIKDFEQRFGRKPEGMWCGETAVNTPTLELLAKHGIQFTILSPFQAQNVRKIGEAEWLDVSGAKVDPRRAYQCQLPSGNKIALFFYDGPVSKSIAFEHLLDDGDAFYNKLMACVDQDDAPQLAHIATDGESYGHHHHFGEMALAYALNAIEHSGQAQVTVYGEFLEKFPPEWEAQIVENSSWSCIHGVERWKSNCGCNAGTPNWHQNWRAPLREAFDWLRDQLIPVYEEQMAFFTDEPWKVRDAYIDVVMNRSGDHVLRFLKQFSKKELSREEQTKVLELLEMQYHTMLMYTSCGWFFDEVTGLESMQDIMYAARALQLAKNVTGKDFEPEFIQWLAKAPSNLPEHGNAGEAYKKYIQPAVTNLLRVGAHYAISSLFSEYPDVLDIYSFKATSEIYELQLAGKYKLATGKAVIHSKITWEEGAFCFCVLHLGEHQLFAGIRPFLNKEAYELMHQEINGAFDKGNVQEVLMLIDKHFGSHHYSFWHLFRDDQKRIVSKLLENDLQGMESMYRQMYDNHYHLMHIIQDMGMPLPQHMKVTRDVVMNNRIKKIIENGKVDQWELHYLQSEIARLNVDLDTVTLNFLASIHVAEVLEKFANNFKDYDLLRHAIGLIKAGTTLSLDPDFWRVRNIVFVLKKKHYDAFKQAADDDPEAKEWCDHFGQLLAILNLKIADIDIPDNVKKLETTVM